MTPLREEETRRAGWLVRPLGGRRTLAAASLGGALAALVAYLISLREYGAGDGGEGVARLVRQSYLLDVARANAKLAALLVVAGAALGAVAGLALVARETLRGRPTRRGIALLAGALALVFGLARGFVASFVESPGGVVALFPYDSSRLDPLYDHVRPWMVAAFDGTVAAGLAALVLLALARRHGQLVPKALRAARRLIVPSSPFLPVPVPAVAAVAIVGVAGSFAARGRGPALDVDPRPNVLVLMSDSLRADRVGAVRHGEPVTPSIDALAARGCKFTNCFVPVARTTESCVSLLTASWPHSHGVRTSWVAPEQCRLRVPTFPERFRAAGYDTYATGEWNASDFGRFECGFERTDVPEETWNIRTIVSRGGRGTALLVRLLYGNALGAWLVPEVYHYPGAYGCDAVTARVERELERAARSRRPSLVVAFYAPTHAPFTARGEHLHSFTDPDYRGANRYCLMAHSIDDAVSLQANDLRAKDLEQVKGLYDAATRTFDDHVGAVLARLQATGLAERTIVVVLSDHGTAFYERGSFGQGNEIASDVSNRIPLVVFDPREHAHPGARAEHVVRSIDLAPTLCDLAGVPAPGVWDGRSLRPVLEDPARDLGLVAYAETGLWIGKQKWQSHELDFGFPSVYDMLEVPDLSSGLIAAKAPYVQLMIRAQHRMIRDDRWKLLYVPTRGAPRVSLYDLAGVPPGSDSPSDVAALHPDVVARLSQTLQSFLDREPPEAIGMTFPEK